MPEPRVIIVGSGFAGIGAAIRARQAGHDDITILERAEAVGGTWRDNTYPGAACDIPAHLYSFSFAPKADWSTVYPRQPEIRAYLERCVADHGLEPLIRFGAEVAGARFDESSATWDVTTTDGRTFTGEVLIMAAGPLSDPKIPAIPGRDAFAGPQFHSARWDHQVDLTDRHVGVVGTGASSIQFLPHVAADAATVTVFQRSAPWIIPRFDRRFTALEKAVFEHVPGARELYRRLIYWQKELRFSGFGKDDPGMRLMQSYALWNMRRHVEDPALRAALTPDYPMGCKRILISSDYYPAVAQEHVEVVPEAVAEITPGGAVTAGGRTADLDVLIWATGFRVDEPLGTMTITGLGGRDLAEAWTPHPVAHLGTTVPGFPNLFVVLGPNTGLGHNSMIYMMESQFTYILDALERLRDRRVAYLDVRADALSDFTDEVADRNQELVWAAGCRSWYLTEDGYNFSLWPAHTYEYRRRTRRLDADEYAIVGPDELPARDARARTAPT